MFYSIHPTPTNQWPSTAQYESYTPPRRKKVLWCFGFGVFSIILCVAATVVVFAVEHSWFYDSFNYTAITTSSKYLNYYGLWRLCIFPNQTCDTWFSAAQSMGYHVDQRLNQAKIGINAWQALEIVFLFLSTSALIIALVAIIFHRSRENIHYYLAVLSVFCIWPAACVGVAGLFVFGFSVYNVATEPRGLDWCFYVDIAAVALSLIGAILLSMYGALLRRPRKTNDNDPVVDALSDLHAYPGNFNPSPYVFVKRKKEKRKKLFDYPEIFYPSQYFTPGVLHNRSNPDFVNNPNHQMLPPYTSTVPNRSLSQPVRNQPPLIPTPVAPRSQRTRRSKQYRVPDLQVSPSKGSFPPQPWYNQSQLPLYSHEPPHWYRPGVYPMNYSGSPNNNNNNNNNYIQHGPYRSTRLNPTGFVPPEEPRVLHYYTGFDHFSTIDPNDSTSPRYNPSQQMPSGSPVQYSHNFSYYQKNGY